MTTMSLNLHLFSFIYYYFKLNKKKKHTLKLSKFFWFSPIRPNSQIGEFGFEHIGLGLGLGLGLREARDGPYI